MLPIYKYRRILFKVTPPWSSYFSGLEICSFAQMFFARLLKIAHGCSLQKCDPEPFAHFALYKRATVSDYSRHSLKKSHINESLFKTEQCEWSAHDLSGLLEKNERFALKFCIFHMFFTVFPLLILKSELLLSLFLHFLFFKERLEWFASIALHSFVLFWRATWAICSHRSLQKSNREWFAQAAHDKRATVRDLLRSLMTQELRECRIHSFLWANRSFTLSLTNNEWIAQKNRWANSQPCYFIIKENC